MSDRILHEETHIHTVEGFDFPALLAKSAVEEKRQRAKAEIIELLRTAAEARARWLEQTPESVFS